MHEFYFHEQDVGQEQIVPIQWRDLCLSRFRATDVRDSSPHGVLNDWGLPSGLMQRSESLPRLDMTPARFAQLLQPHSKQFDSLLCPLSEEDEAELTGGKIGFGPEAGGGIVAETDGGAIERIWCNTYASDIRASAKLADMFAALTTDQHLMLVDWGLQRMADLRDKAEVLSYLGLLYPGLPCHRASAFDKQLVCH